MNPHEELKALSGQIETVYEVEGLKSIYYRLDDIAKGFPNDFELQMAVGDVRQQIVARATRLQQMMEQGIAPPPPPPAMPPPFPPAPPSQTGMPPLPPSAFGTSETPSAGMMGIPPPPPPMGPPMPPMGMPPQAMAPPPQPGKKFLLLGGLIGLLLALGAGGYLLYKRNGGTEPQPIAVKIATTPSGAAIRVNDENKCTSDCEVQLAPGDYQVMALLDGYEAAAGVLTVKEGAPASLALTLEPQPVTVRILTDFQQGKVKLDDQPEADLIEGQFTLEKVAPGAHVVTVTGPLGRASANFSVENAQMPGVTNLTAQNVLGVTVSTFARKARVVSSTGPLKLAVNGQPQAEASPSGVDLAGYEPGISELVLGEGADQKSVKENFTPAPSLALFLKSNDNVGTLIVSTGNESDVRVFINDREQGRRTFRGEFRMRYLGRVNVRIAKDGMETPPAQTAEIRKGAEVRMEFPMKPAPTFSSLQIRNGTPGADVLLDLRQIGAVGADGTFTSNSILPGNHVIELRRDQYQTKRFDREFRAGQPVVLGATEAVLASDRPAPKDPPPVVEPKKVEPPPPVKPPPPPPPKVYSMGDFDNPGAWMESGGIWVHRGAAHLTYAKVPRGVYNFTIQLRRGGNIFRGGRVRWFADYTDARNHALFEMDDKNFWVKDVVNGRTTDRSKTEHKAGERTWTVQVEVGQDRIVHKMQIGSQWYNLDTWEQAGRDFSKGRFGFLVQGDNEIAVSDFRYTPSR